MEIRSFEPLSVGKLLGAIYFVIGLIVAVPFALFALLAAANQEMGGGMGIFGVSAVVIFPLGYGIGAFVMGLLTAVLYNVFAGIVGGIRIEFVRNQ